ncbi:MAG: hypothetical protein LC715_00235 [Gammaproteobacteria bacterium]|nr:hypothetical protein [Gammaproteobacteria bacterium]
MTDDGKRRASWLERRWPAIRARGRLHFVLTRGLLLWGGLMTAAVSAMLLYTERAQGMQLRGIWPLVPALCLPAGALWGLLAWHWNEALFRRFRFDKDDPSQ